MTHFGGAPYCLTGGAIDPPRATAERGGVSTYLWIAAGGALGSVARYGCSSLIAGWFGETFPLGTLIINVLGSFGGYTTFSSFSYQTLTLAQDGQYARAGVNVVASVVLCLLAVWLGFVGAAAVNAVRGS